MRSPRAPLSFLHLQNLPEDLQRFLSHPDQSFLARTLQILQIFAAKVLRNRPEEQVRLHGDLLLEELARGSGNHRRLRHTGKILLNTFQISMLFGTE